MSDLQDWFEKQNTDGVTYEDFKAAYHESVRVSGDEANRGNENPFLIARVATLACVLAYNKSKEGSND